MWQGGLVIDNGEALESVIRHAAQLGEIDYDEIASTVDALTVCRDISLLPRLRAALDRFLDEENVYGRDLIAGMLAGIAGVAALPALLLAAARDLGDDQDGLQAEIAGLVAADPETSRRLVLELVDNGEPEQRRAGLLALGSVAAGDDLELLAEAATDADVHVRLMAIEAVADPAGNDRAFEVLVASLHDPDERVRMSTITRLDSTRRPDAVTPLAAVADDPAPRVRTRTAYALGRLGHAEATPILVRLLDDADRHVHDQALDALGSIGGHAAVDALLAEATDPDPRRRAQAAKALAKATDSDRRVTPAIMQLARDAEPAVRAATLSGLATAAGNSSRWARLVAELTNDPDPIVRQRVAVVAAHLAPGQAADLLHRLTDDHEATVRQVATTQLDRMRRSRPEQMRWPRFAGRSRTRCH
jgi:HEAT repeat protein